MKFSKNFIEKVLNATDIVELVSDHGIVLKKTGVNFKGLCTFHSEKTPSFNVNSQRGFFHCFGCKASGDSIKFLMQIDRISFTDSIDPAQILNRSCTDSVEIPYSSCRDPLQILYRCCTDPLEILYRSCRIL